MRKRGRAMRELSPAQQRIMECIWQHGELSINDLCGLLASKRKVARNTVRTLVERMEAKGWLKHREEGRTYIYSAATSKDAAVGQKIVEMVERVCSGSPETLMAGLINFRGLTPDELIRIRQMLEHAQTRVAPQQEKRT
jgi:BlaI family transcriptional regulator, penicillinase repressor